VIDNEDPTAPEYYRRYGEQAVMFDKQQIATTFDTGDNFDNRKTIVYARNACWKIAEERHIEAFVQLDDDYYWFGYRTATGAKSTRRLDTLFALLVTFLHETPITSVAFSQGGDHIGGYDDTKRVSRKAMNSFVCLTQRKFTFIGRINEDVNTYVLYGGREKYF
jgi:hypothetical protein